jgi:peptidoglycan/xylan/chitin deacetylase (PgdA/CDA1 family)
LSAQDIAQAAQRIAATLTFASHGVAYHCTGYADMATRELVNTDGTADTTHLRGDRHVSVMPVKQIAIDNFCYPEGVRLAVNWTVDFDAMLFRVLNEESIQAISKGEFGGRVGIWRLLELFDKHSVKATIFTPGRICELYPDSLRAAAEQGHEIADHMWEHRVPREPGLALDHIRKTAAALEQTIGKRPKGSRSSNRISHLASEGYQYYSTAKGEVPCWAYDADGSRILNLPFAWELDDAQFFNFRAFGAPINGHRLEDPDKTFDIWLAAFHQLYKAGGYMDITLHPFVSGRAFRIDMLDRLLFEMKKMPGVWFPTCEELSDYCYANFLPKP